MLSMQDEDGGVWHKQTSERFCGFIMPGKDTLVSAPDDIGELLVALDGKFVPAEAVIRGDAVVVSSPQVSAPNAARNRTVSPHRRCYEVSGHSCSRSKT